ncbi:MAG: DUF3486 family protein [Aquamicrobium sp.]|nr:DUF3486 family protein [Aquamicrobium sp.]
MAKRAGRGRLSAIDLLPPECDELISWAAKALTDRNRHQTDIYAEWRQKLIALQGETGVSFDIPSFQAFNRYSLRLTQMTRRLEQTREIAGAISDRFDAATSDDLTLIAAEAIKTLVFELLQEGGEAGLDPKGAMQLAGALYRATQAQGVSTVRRLKVEQEFEQKAEAAIEKVAGELGLPADRVAQLRREFLGVRPKRDGESLPGRKKKRRDGGE